MSLPDRRGCCGTSRRTFLQDTGLGFTGLALSAMLARDGYAAEEAVRPDGQPHFAPKAKAVIWIFLCGGVSHMLEVYYRHLPLYSGDAVRFK